MNKPTPGHQELNRIAQANSFPAGHHDILSTARQGGFSQTLIAFVDLFAPNLQFESQEDFLTRAEELKLVIEQQNDTPDETILSPQL